MFNPALVVGLLSKEFGCDEGGMLSRNERKIADAIVRVLRDALYSDLDVDAHDNLKLDESEEVDRDWEWDGNEPESDDTDTIGEKVIMFDNEEVPIETVKEVIDHYRGTAKGSRSLTSMHSRYRFISTDSHLKKLRSLEKDLIAGREIRENRRRSLRRLACSLKDAVTAKFDAGHELHDSDLKRMALEINRQQNLVQSFKARWIYNWKKQFRICSRRITTFIAKKNLKDRRLIETQARQFVANVRNDIASRNLPLACIANADQSGFLKEMHSARSLAPVGARTVERVVQSMAATTHSFSIMPIIYMNGSLGDKLFVVLQEKNGEFPNVEVFNAPNLVVRANTTHIMTKKLMMEWFSEVVFRKPTYLIVDSWSSFRDHTTIMAAKPPGLNFEIHNIPGGATSLIQPLDVFFFRLFKSFVRKITAYIITYDMDFVIFQRNNILKVFEYPEIRSGQIISLTHWTFGAEQFRPCIQYAWKAAGYTDARPDDFQTPADYCFGGDLAVPCEKPRGCGNMAFIKCAYCDQRLCFDCFVVSYHHC